MKTYTIKGKEYSEFDINKRCAELMGVYVALKGSGPHMYLDKGPDEEYNPFEIWDDTGPIIEKCWDELNAYCANPTTIKELMKSKWLSIIEKHKCTKLVAACICFIEVNL